MPLDPLLLGTPTSQSAWFKSQLLHFPFCYALEVQRRMVAWAPGSPRLTQDTRTTFLAAHFSLSALGNKPAKGRLATLPSRLKITSRKDV